MAVWLTMGWGGVGIAFVWLDAVEGVAEKRLSLARVRVNRYPLVMLQMQKNPHWAGFSGVSIGGAGGIKDLYIRYCFKWIYLKVHY